MRPRQPRRIGIYAGAFDPVHAGHLSFALQAIEAARLDEVVFLPERMPPGKPGVEHYAHRVGMLRRALAPHPKLSVMEMVDRRYTVRRTLPGLEAVFPGDRLVLLMGSDVVRHLPDWPQADRLLKRTGLIVAVRSGATADEVSDLLGRQALRPLDLTIVESIAPDISSAAIRQALRADKPAPGLLTSVRRYARREWLYVSVR